MAIQHEVLQRQKQLKLARIPLELILEAADWALAGTSRTFYHSQGTFARSVIPL